MSKTTLDSLFETIRHDPESIPQISPSDAYEKALADTILEIAKEESDMGTLNQFEAYTYPAAFNVWQPMLQNLTEFKSIDEYINLKVEVAQKIYDWFRSGEYGPTPEFDIGTFFERLCSKLGIFKSELINFVNHEANFKTYYNLLENSYEVPKTAKVLCKDRDRRPKDKILTLSETIEVANEVRANEIQRIVLYMGKFRQTFHDQQIVTVNEIRRGIRPTDLLVVLMESRRSILHRFEEQGISVEDPDEICLSDYRRQAAISGFEGVDIVTVNDPPDLDNKHEFFADTWERLRPDIVVVGEKDYYQLERFREMSRRVGNLLLYVHDTALTSTTQLLTHHI